MSLYPNQIEPWNKSGDLSLARLERIVDLFHRHTHRELEDPVNVVAHWNADNTGAEDTTEQIRDAIEEAERTKRSLYFPPGTYKVTSTGSEIFTITRPIEVFGAGWHSIIMPSTGTPTTTDVFLYDPIDGIDGSTFPYFHSFRIVGQSAGVARYGIHVRAGVLGDFVRRLGLERLWFENLSSFAVFINSPPPSSGVFTSWMRDCQVWGNGFGSIDLFDSWLIQNNVFAGIGRALDIDWTAGPGKFILEGCNISASGGCRFNGSGMAGLSIINNYFETQQAFTGTDDAFVNLNGAPGSGYIQGANIESNIFTILSGNGDPDALRINYCSDAIIDKNWFLVSPASSFAINITANALRTHRGHNTFVQAGGQEMLNAGSMSTGSHKVICALKQDSASVSNTTNLTAYNKFFSFPPGHFKTGQVYRIRATGVFSCSGTPTLLNEIVINPSSLGPPVVPGVVLALQQFVCSSNAVSLGWVLEGYLVCRAAGAPGTFSRSSFISNAITATDFVFNSISGTMNIYIASEWSVADVSNTSKLTQFTIELMDSVVYL